MNALRHRHAFPFRVKAANTLSIIVSMIVAIQLP